MLVSIAFKNMLRYKRRTLVTSCAVAFGVMFSIVFNGFLTGMNNESIRNLIDYETSGAKFFADGYFKERETLPLDYLIEENSAKEIGTFLDSKNISFTPEILLPCEVYFNEEYFETSGSITGILCALDPKKSEKVFKTASQIESGSWLKKEEGEEYCTGAVIGSWIADDMKAQPGWYVTIQCKGRGGFMQTIDVPITGIVHCPDVPVNASYIFMDIAYINEMLEMEGAVTAIDTNLGGMSTVNSNVKKLKKDFSEIQNDSKVKLYSWNEIAEDIVSVQKMYEGISSLIMLFLFIVAAVGISNTMLMSVLERKNEIAMLKAMGYTPFYIKSLFMTEGVLIGCTGCVIGMVAGCLINIPLVNVGIDFTQMLSNIDIGYRISGLIRSDWNFTGFAKIIFGALLIAAFASYFPSRSISKKEIAEIFRKN